MGLKSEKLRPLIALWRDRGIDCRHGAWEMAANELEAIIGPPPQNLPPIEVTGEEFRKEPAKYCKMAEIRTVRVISGGCCMSMGPPIDLDE